MIPWLIVALIAVPLLIVVFAATRRRTVAYEHPAGEDALTDQELADAEAFQAKWREADQERYHQDPLP